MENYSQYFERIEIASKIKNLLLDFDEKQNNMDYKKGVYIYGGPGSGKTTFITQLLKELDYDIIHYDAGYVRNKSLIDTITCDRIASQNVLQMMEKKRKRIVIVMDEIDGMNNGDKGGIMALIKLIRQKKTKRQKLENKTMNPIICIGGYNTDKKIRELMNVCNVFELPTPTPNQLRNLLENRLPNYNVFEPNVIENAIKYIDGDLRKLDFVMDYAIKKPEKMNKLERLFEKKSYNEDAKKITHHLLNNSCHIDTHSLIMNETERTIVSLLWHENVIDMLENKKKEKALPLYLELLDNICYADYVDRITFQSQIWQFNEMSSLMKTFHNNQIYHEVFPENRDKYQPNEVRFTKVLTKYSTEYNNMLFLYNLCETLSLDKKDLLCMFEELRMFKNTPNIYKNDSLLQIEKWFEDYEISKLEIRRIYRYLDKNEKKESADDYLLENDMDDKNNDCV
uniref:AAA+ ATPase domain-containing protein n=1 Tax=viral metagenome TaxID=1070528 RepID=A0A6C0AUQ5_9ZZZZ|tara:strand:+ start:19228 stop:20589 length:1362 start_codon:yes stop_codon:yes gene_type:complete